MLQADKIFRWLNRYKVLHILFWGWSFYQIIHVRMEMQGGGFYKHLSKATSLILFEMLCVYGIIYGMLPRSLKQRRYVRFFFLALLWILVTALTEVMAHKLFLLVFQGKSINYGNFLIFFVSDLFDYLTASAVFTAIAIFSTLYRTTQHNRQLQQERLEAELAFLKSQTSPHFLFNALNSIYVLIDLDQRQARETLLQFSGLLRYQLYECNEAEVFLEKEVRFLEDYIRLEETRVKYLHVSFERPAVLPSFRLSPLLLIPLVENAFKYVSRGPDQDNFIRIRVEADEQRVAFRVENSRERDVADDGSTAKGIGLQNLARRLRLLYPDRHELIIEQPENVFRVSLTLHAAHHELHHR